MRIIGVMGLVMVMGPKNDCGTSKEATEEVATNAASNASVIDVTATQLFKDYDANEVNADDKYKGKVLRVTGTISTIGKDILDTPYIAFATSNEIMSVQCMFDDTGILGSLRKGQKLTVRCKGDGKLGNVILRGCMIDK